MRQMETRSGAMLQFVLALALIWQPVTPLEGEWRVDVVDGINVMPDSVVTLRFRGTGISGLASCNNYSGGYSLDGTAFKTTSILSTMKACSRELMSQERDVLYVLRSAVRAELKGKDALVLTTADRKTLTATRVVGKPR
jgi:heat shock protein HslJ